MTDVAASIAEVDEPPRAAAGGDDAGVERWRIDVAGAVQGVGFRPLVHRLAVAEGLGGFVRNAGDAAVIEIEGERAALARFVARLDADVAPPARVRERRVTRVHPLLSRCTTAFEIAPSASGADADADGDEDGNAGRPLASVLPDLAICAACAAEIADPNDRRHRYPFTTCTHCGPRFSVIDAVPYDRERTSMRRFRMCAACRAEYDDPASRRFHAQTNACAACGPQLALWDRDARMQAAGDAALREAARRIRDGEIVAMKGLGGFQLLADARNEAVLERLRARKRRPTKPFAIMVRGLDDAAVLAEVGPIERAALASAAAPIVLLRAHERHDDAGGAARAALAPNVAPGNPWLGIMLAYTPLHRLLIDELGFPLVATSGNRGGEPIVFDERDALARLADIADCLLVHDRPIVHPVDDSVVRVIDGAPVVLRHARGYAPSSFSLDPSAEGQDCEPCVALGGHGKSALAASAGGRLVLGPYIGDLDDGRARDAFERAFVSLQALHRVTPAVLACDTHPDYYGTRVAEREIARVQRIQHVQRVPHHLAHVLSGIVEHGLRAPVLGIAWDGAGRGGDGTVWGGEFLAIGRDGFRRVAHLLPFRLPGGDAAARDPRRSALGVLHAISGDPAWAIDTMAARPVSLPFADGERPIFAAMLARGVRSPWTSSAGRLFDAVAALLGLCVHPTFEGEAAIAVEAAALRASQRDDAREQTCAAAVSSSMTRHARSEDECAFENARAASHTYRRIVLAAPTLDETDRDVVADWRAPLASLIEKRRQGAPADALAAAFHDSLTELIVALARRAGIRQVLLTGGCFQNARLASNTACALRDAGFDVALHRRAPPNDGGLALGQAAFAARPLADENEEKRACV